MAPAVRVRRCLSRNKTEGGGDNDCASEELSNMHWAPKELGVNELRDTIAIWKTLRSKAEATGDLSDLCVDGYAYPVKSVMASVFPVKSGYRARFLPISLLG